MNPAEHFDCEDGASCGPGAAGPVWTAASGSSVQRQHDGFKDRIIQGGKKVVRSPRNSEMPDLASGAQITQQPDDLRRDFMTGRTVEPKEIYALAAQALKRCLNRRAQTIRREIPRPLPQAAGQKAGFRHHKSIRVARQCPAQPDFAKAAPIGGTRVENGTAAIKHLVNEPIAGVIWHQRRGKRAADAEPESRDAGEPACQRHPAPPDQLTAFM